MPPTLFLSIELPAGLSGLAPGLLQAGGTVASLALLEAVLSADNAVALAGIVQGVASPERRRRLLNRGLVGAFLLRGLMVLAAGWLIHFEPARLLGGAYLVWLALRHFQEELEAGEPVGDRREAPDRCHEQGPEQGAAQGGEQGVEEQGAAQGVEQGDLALLATIAGTDLAFSLDSVSASVAVTEALPLVVLGGGLGVLMLRFLAGWVLGWMERYVHLANAAYLTVLAVGLKMLAASLAPVLVPAPGVLLVGMVILFGWGFSQTREPRLPPVQAALIGGSAAGRVLSSSSNGVCSSPSFTKPNTSRL
jgi:YkoY family integral membrane protein